MATFKYFIKGNGKLATIYVRFYQGRKFDLKKSTSLLINPNYWNTEKGTVKQIAKFDDKTNLKNRLNELQTHIENKYNDGYMSGMVINGDWLGNTINTFFNQDNQTDLNYLLDFALHFIETLPSKVLNNGKTGVTANTLKRYGTIVNKIREFEKVQQKRIKIIDVNLRFYQDFKHFLTVKQGLNLNTTGRYLIYIKTLCIEAKQYGIKINPEVERKEFRETKEETTFITLSESEIEQIHQAKLTAPYLDNARKWLIIGVWTGARVSDLLKFTEKNVTNGFIEYTAQKTGQKIILPLHPQVKEVLRRSNGEFPKPISNQKFNDYIKKVCQKVKINQKVDGAKQTEIKKGVWRKQKNTFEKWELVSTHICRRSFATNHYGKLPTPVIMAVTGHATEKMFLKYIGKTSKDNAETLNNYWQNQETKKRREPKLTAIKNAI